jgi:hypothetical protein
MLLKDVHDACHHVIMLVAQHLSTAVLCPLTPITLTTRLALLLESA